jgi:hypothetical protein
VLAENDAARLELHLWSEAEQRIPHAARQKFFTQRLREFFEWEKMDLHAYIPGLAPGSIVQGPPALIEFLKGRLNVQP